MKKIISLSILGLIIGFKHIGAQQRNNFSIAFTKDKTILPITYRSGANPVVQVRINGKGPYRFMFDTGSPFLLKLDERVFQELNLSVVDSVRAGDGSGRNARSFYVTNIESLTLGDFTIQKSDAMVRNYNTRAGVDSIDGVVGLSFFDGYLVELNFESNQLIISKNNLNAQNANTFPIQQVNGVPATSIKLGNEQLSAIFDTGNMGGLTIHAKNARAENMLTEPRVIGRAQTVSNTFEIKEVQLTTPLTIGATILEKPIVILNDMIPTTNMGIRLLKQFNIAFDMKNNLVCISKFEPKIAVGSINEYEGTYGDRVITVGADKQLYLQRPGGMLLKLVPKKNDEYGIEIVPNAFIQFQRNETGKITGIKVTKPDGTSEIIAKS